MRDIVISETEELNPLQVTYTGKVGAIIINSGDHAYAKVRFDEHTMKNFTEKLNQVEDYLERATVWRHLWNSVNDGTLNPMHYVDFVVKQLPKETIE